MCELPRDISLLDKVEVSQNRRISIIYFSISQNMLYFHAFLYGYIYIGKYGRCCQICGQFPCHYRNRLFPTLTQVNVSHCLVPAIPFIL